MKPPYLNALRILICAFSLGAEMMIRRHTIELPDTPPGKTLEEFIKAFNTGELEPLKRFHKEHGGDEENAWQDMGFFQQTGGLKPHSVKRSDEFGIEVLAQTKKDEKWVSPAIG